MLRNNLTNGVLTRPFPASLRTRLERHLADLRPAFAPAKTDEIEAAVAELMARFFSARSVSPMEAKVTVRAYADSLSGSPLWAVREVCRRVGRGEVEGASLDFPPAAPRLRAAVDEVMAPVTKEHFDIKALLQARVEVEPTPEERARVGVLFDDLLRSLKMGNASDRKV